VSAPRKRPAAPPDPMAAATAAIFEVAEVLCVGTVGDLALVVRPAPDSDPPGVWWEASVFDWAEGSRPIEDGGAPWTARGKSPAHAVAGVVVVLRVLAEARRAAAAAAVDVASAALAVES